MDAEIAWNVWRRILKDDRLSEYVVDGADSLAELGLTTDELAIVAAYAAHPKGSRWAIETYRYRLVSAALSALATGGQLTQRLLLRNNLDLRRLAQRFVDVRGKVDDGPFVYHTCSAFLRFIETSDDVRDLHGLRDILAIDSAATNLIIRCSRLPSEYWSTADDCVRSPADPRTAWYVQTELGTVITTTLRVTPWLTNAELFGCSPLDQQAEHLLVFLPDLLHRYSLRLIGDKAAALFRRMATPCSYADLVDEFGGGTGHDDDARGSQLIEALTGLAKLGVIRVQASRDEIYRSDYASDAGE